MAYHWLWNAKALIIFPLVLLLGLIAACGDDDTPAPVVQKEIVEVTKVVTEEVIKIKEVVVERVVVPTAVPTAMAPPPPPPPSGTLRVIVEEYGRAAWSPFTQTAGMTSVSDTTFAEPLWHLPPPAGTIQGLLLESWEISEDGTTWVLNLRQDIPFHFNFGDVTTDDIIFNLEDAIREGTSVGRQQILINNWFAEGGGMTKIDDQTLVVNTVEPKFDFTWELSQSQNPGYGLGILSKAYHDSVGPERAPFAQAVGTGPWRSREFGGGVWKFDAVEDHWRKTPNFAELDYREIAEESTRVANFQAGHTDTVQLNTESVEVLKSSDPNLEVLKFNVGGNVWINIHGLQYVEQPWIPAQDCSVAYVSCNSDINSVEWENARKVREAMNISIDRELLVETLLRGNGSVAHHYGWTGFDAQLGELADLTYDFDPARARQLLVEAGFPNGFEVNMSLTPRPYPGTTEGGEAVAIMWEEIGITTVQQNITMGAFRGHFPGRDYVGLNTHASAVGPEPQSRLTACLWRSCDGFSYGWSHPITDALIDTMDATFDTEERFQASRDVSRFLFEQSATIPLLNTGASWPISDQVQPWDWNCCIASYPSRLEYVEHAQ